MADIVRTGVSLERELLEAFDRVVEKRGYQNRSEAIRDLIREHLISREADQDRIVVGTLTLLYDHHRPGLTERLTEAQHHAGGRVMAATHVHLDHDNCLEVIIMKGRSGQLQQLADQLLSLRGVKHGKLVLSATGKNLK